MKEKSDKIFRLIAQNVLCHIKINFSQITVSKKK